MGNGALVHALRARAQQSAKRLEQPRGHFGIFSVRRRGDALEARDRHPSGARAAPQPRLMSNAAYAVVTIGCAARFRRGMRRRSMGVAGAVSSERVLAQRRGLRLR